MSTQAELQAAHGTPKQFEGACKRAWIDGHVTFQEAMEATELYEREFAAAPQNSNGTQETQQKAPQETE
jgi:hypothetical protein